VSGNENHAMKCSDCFIYLSYADNYNILISSLATDAVANSTVLQDSRIVDDSNSGHDAIKLMDDIWNNLCVKGVHVVVNFTNTIFSSKEDIDEWVDHDFVDPLGNDITKFQVGEKKTITVWA